MQTIRIIGWALSCDKQGSCFHRRDLTASTDRTMTLACLLATFSVIPASEAARAAAMKIQHRLRCARGVKTDESTIQSTRTLALQQEALENAPGVDQCIQTPHASLFHAQGAAHFQAWLRPLVGHTCITDKLWSLRSHQQRLPAAGFAASLTKTAQMAASRVQLGVALLAVLLAAVSCSSEQLPAATAEGSNLITAEEMNQRVASMAASRKLAGYKPIPIDASVVLLFMSDVEGGDNSPCVQMVKRALEFKGRAINFFVTAYYADWNGDNKVEGLGYKESQYDKSFKAFNYNSAYRFSKGLSYCMKKAVDNNMYIVTHIHLDDGLDKGTWRNAVIFNPNQKYGGLTFWEAVAKPTAVAIKDANYRKRDVYYAMQAEMGATLFYYPTAWRQMIGQVKQVISSGGTPWNKVKVGVNVNWEKICGCPADLIYSTNYYSDLKNNWWKVQKAVNIPEVQKLFRSVDFIGVSAYAGLPRYPTLSDLETSLRKVDQELGMFGMSLKGLDKEIIYSEYGLGGGKTGDYRTPADSSYTVAASPYWGVDGVYSSAMDPWQKSDNRQFMQQYYQLTTEYAKRGGVNYPVTGIFLWNIISYDVLGIHYMSSSKQGSYRDYTVSAMITNYNYNVRVARG